MQDVEAPLYVRNGVSCFVMRVVLTPNLGKQAVSRNLRIPHGRGQCSNGCTALQRWRPQRGSTMDLGHPCIAQCAIRWAGDVNHRAEEGGHGSFAGRWYFVLRRCEQAVIATVFQKEMCHPEVTNYRTLGW